MLVGQNSLFYSFASFGGDANGRAGGASAFDMKNYAFPEGYELGGKDSTEWAGAGKDPVQSANDALAQAFLDWAQKSPEEKIRERILAAKGLDEESLKELPPAEQDAINDEIRQAVKQVFGVKDTGGAATDPTDKTATAAT
jgi:hypothetical protein